MGQSVSVWLFSMEAYVCSGEIEAIFHRTTEADGFIKLSRAYCPDDLTRQEWIQKLKEQINEYGHWFTIEDVRRQNMLAAKQEPAFMRLK